MNVLGGTSSTAGGMYMMVRVQFLSHHLPLYLFTRRRSLFRVVLFSDSLIYYSVNTAIYGRNGGAGGRAGSMPCAHPLSPYTAAPAAGAGISLFRCMSVCFFFFWTRLVHCSDFSTRLTIILHRCHAIVQ